MKLAKKLLAVVLALAMILGMTVTSSAAFEGETITYKEAVEVMTLAGVIEGDNYGKFNPTDTLTRAQAAKIIVYMLGMEDVSVSYTANFSDIKGHWAEKYITIANGLGIVAGVGNGKYDPEGTLTGYQWAKMLVTAMGYNAEYEGLLGSGWEANTAKLIKKLGMTKGIAKWVGIADLPREEACQMAYNVFDDYFVEYHQMGAAYSIARTTNENFPEILGFKKVETMDAFGRPVNYFWIDVNADGKYEVLKDKYIVLNSEAEKTYTTAQTFCSVLQDFGLPETYNVYANYNIGEKLDTELVYTNGAYGNKFGGQTTAEYTTKAAAVSGVEVLDKVTSGAIYHNAGACVATNLVGAQGQTIEIYNVGTALNPVYRFVIVDTYLAKVTGVTPSKTVGGHTTDAYTTVTVYDDTTGESVKLTGLTGYAKGDYILVQIADNSISGTYAATQYKVLGKAETVVGKQSAITLKSKKTELTRTIEGTEYVDAHQFNLDETTLKTDECTWYLDQYGNVIGVVPVATVYSYAVVTSITLVDEKKGNDYLMVDLTYIDGTTAEDVAIYKFRDETAATWKNDYKYLTYTDEELPTLLANHLYRIYESALGLVLEDAHATEDNKVEYNKVYAVKSTVESGDTTIGDVKVDDATMFLIRSGRGDKTSPFTYKAITGIDNIGDYEENVVHYVYLNDGNLYADYVYVIADAEDEIAYQWVYITDTTKYSKALLLNDIYYYNYIGAVDLEGQPVMLSVKRTYETDKVYYAADKEPLLVELHDAANSLVLVKTVDGFVDEITNVADCHAVKNADAKTSALLEYYGTEPEKKLEFNDNGTLEFASTGYQDDKLKIYNLDATTVVLLDGMKLDDTVKFERLTDENLHDFDIEDIWVVFTTASVKAAKTIVLTTEKNTRPGCDDPAHDAIYTVCVKDTDENITTVAALVGEGYEVSLAQYSAANAFPGTGYKVGENGYVAKNGTYVVNSEDADDDEVITLEANYVLYTFKSSLDAATLTKVAVEYKTEPMTIADAYKTMGDGVTPNSKYVCLKWVDGESKEDYRTAGEQTGRNIDVTFIDGYKKIEIANSTTGAVFMNMYTTASSIRIQSNNQAKTLYVYTLTNDNAATRVGTLDSNGYVDVTLGDDIKIAVVEDCADITTYDEDDFEYTVLYSTEKWKCAPTPALN